MAKMEAFKSQGKILADYYDLFKPVSWMSVYTGMGVTPDRADALVDLVPQAFSRQVLQGVIQAIRQAAAAQPAHEAVLGGLMRRPIAAQ